MSEFTQISSAVLSCVSNEAQIRGRRFFETQWSKMGIIYFMAKKFKEIQRNIFNYAIVQ